MSMRASSTPGFTLIEVIVSIGLFAAVMLISVGTLLALVAANRKAQTLETVVGNLNIAIDEMVRSIRMGSYYHCGGGTYSSTQDCVNGDTTIAFESVNGSITNGGDQWIYRYDSGDKRIYKSEDSGINWTPITAPGIVIEEANFYVIGSTRGDTTQPKTLIELRGEAGLPGTRTSTDFHIQATAVQRTLDL